MVLSLFSWKAAALLSPKLQWSVFGSLMASALQSYLSKQHSVLSGKQSHQEAKTQYKVRGGLGRARTWKGTITMGKVDKQQAVGVREYEVSLGLFWIIHELWETPLKVLSHLLSSQAKSIFISQQLIKPRLDAFLKKAKRASAGELELQRTC